MSEVYVLGIDVGGTEIKYGVVNYSGDIVFSEKIATSYNKEIFLGSLLEIIDGIQQKFSIDGVSFSFPGFINYKTGELLRAGALTFLDGFNLRTFIESNTGLKCHVENDVNTVVMAEKISGNARECENFICITVGTGIGGGVFINNSLYRGKNFAAGEFGYMIVKGIENNVPGECIMSASSAIGGLRKKYSKKYQKNFDSVTGFDIFDGSDQYAIYLRNQFYENLSLLLYNLFYALNPEKILIGGAISQRDELILNLNRRIEMLVEDNSISLEIDRCFHKNNAGIIGAAAHYFKMEEKYDK